MKDYVEIGTLFDKALEGMQIGDAFEAAIRIMKRKPELAARIRAWDDTVWLCIEEYLNKGEQLSQDNADLFCHACALLDE